jgi:hypothetical protein
MLYREIIAVCSQIHTKHTNTQSVPRSKHTPSQCTVTTGLYNVERRHVRGYIINKLVCGSLIVLHCYSFNKVYELFVFYCLFDGEAVEGCNWTVRHWIHAAKQVNSRARTETKAANDRPGVCSQTTPIPSTYRHLIKLNFNVNARYRAYLTP